MDHSPLVITQYGLARVLKAFAKRLGLDDSLADVTAQVHLQQTDLHENWSYFMATSCTQCQKAPSSCEVFDPKKKNCVGDATPEDVLRANVTMIETGRWKACPALKLVNPA